MDIYIYIPPGPSGVGGFGFQKVSFVEGRILAEKTESGNPDPSDVGVAVWCFAKSCLKNSRPERTA